MIRVVVRKAHRLKPVDYNKTSIQYLIDDKYEEYWETTIYLYTSTFKDCYNEWKCECFLTGEERQKIITDFNPSVDETTYKFLEKEFKLQEIVYTG